MKSTRPISRTELTLPGAAVGNRGRLTRSDVPHRPGELGDEDDPEQRAEAPDERTVERMRSVVLRGVLLPHVQQHDDEQEEHHDGARRTR